MIRTPPAGGAAPPSDTSGGGVPLLGRNWPYLLLGLGVLAMGVASWRPVPAGVWHDDGVYMVVGQALAQGDGLVYAGVPGTPPAAKFPPGYSVLLAGLWALFGGAGPVTLAATLLNLAFLAVAAVLFARALVEAGALPRYLGVGAAGLALVSSDLVRLALVPLSESLFLMGSAGALLLWTRSASGTEGAGTSSGLRPERVLGLGCVLAAVLLVRSAGVAVAAGCVAGFLVRRAWRQAALSALPPLVAFGGWSAWAGGRASEIPPGLQDVLGPYGGWLSEQVAGSPAAFVAGLPGHAAAVLARIGALLVPGLSGPLLLVVALPLGLLGFAGLVRLQRTHPAWSWAAVLYLGMLLVWPYPDRRLVAPLHPLLLGSVAVGGWALHRRMAGARGRAIVLGALLLWGSAYLLVGASRAARGWAVAPYRIRAERLAAAVEALHRVAPQGSVVGAPEFWAGLHLHGGWPTVPSARFRLRSEGGGSPVWGTPDEQITTWRESGVEYLVLEQGGLIHGDALNALEEACEGRVVIAARMPPQMIVRLRWEACPPSG